MSSTSQVIGSLIAGVHVGLTVLNVGTGSYGLAAITAGAATVVALGVITDGFRSSASETTKTQEPSRVGGGKVPNPRSYAPQVA